MSFSGFHRRFSRLVDRLLEPGAVVPFLGAGVSSDCKPPNLPDFEATVSMMERRMRKRLQAIGQRGGVDDGIHFRGVLGHQDADRTGRRETAGFSQLAEVLTWTAGRRATLEACQMRTLADLVPSKAHTYIAYLAREGLITRVLTTNWDRCLERAYAGTFTGDKRLTFGWDHIEDQPACSDGHRDNAHCETKRRQPKQVSRCPLAVITTEREYRALGGRLAMRVAGHDTSVLRIVKINGCAGRLLAASPPCNVEGCDRLTRAEGDIRLTDLDLQRFWNQPWAEDLLLDIARTRNLLFSGFGNDEPQVRHTVLALIAEFKETVGEVTNAPYLQAYEPALGFNQAQTLYTLLTKVDAYTRSTRADADALWWRRAGGKLKRGGVEYWRNYAFTGLDTSYFAAPSVPASRCLEADLFWQRLFQAAYGRLLRRLFDRGAPLLAWLQRASLEGTPLPPPRELLAECMEWLYPSLSSALSRWKSGDSPKACAFQSLFGRLHWLLETAEDHNGGDWGRTPPPLRLSVWMAALTGVDISRQRPNESRRQIAHYVGAHPYFPLAQHAQQVGLLLLVLYLLMRNAGQSKLRPEDVSPTHLGLRVTFPESDICVYLVDEARQPDEDSRGREPGTNTRFALQIRIPSLGMEPAEARAGRLEAKGSSLPKYVVGRVFAAGLYQVIGALAHHEREDALRRLLESLAASVHRRRSRARLTKLGRT